jgi:hypothetical protein
MSSATLRRIELPSFGPPAIMPELPASLYAARLERLRRAAQEHGFDRLVLYADREHSAGVSWLTGFDPRFEEAIVVVGGDDDPAILVGNECYGLAGAAPLPMRRHLHQDLSLPSQPRDRSRSIEAVLADEGIHAGTSIGVIGWKTYADPGWIDVPSWLADRIRALVGPSGSVVNATGLLIDPGTGLRIINEPEQIAAFEYASSHTSQGIQRLLRGLRPGMTEQQAVALLGWHGMPLSCHVMLTAGPRATLGLLSPSDRVIERGDRFTSAYGVWGALTCRAGFVAEDASELPPTIGDYVERLVGPYFEAVAEWYTTLGLGVPGGALQEVIDRRLGDPFFGISLNPGHLLALDEWVSSPVWRGSEVPLRSGMVMQVDIIPATGTQYFTTNIEDGIALADASLRDELASRFPDAWRRIQGRRAFMDTALGIRIAPEVLPLSDIPACLPPFLLSPDHVMTLD